jgi:CMP-N-acetylneuraminic acid synthetase
MLFARIVISTDCNEIAAVAKQCGIDFPFLREDKIDDFSTVSEATLAAIRQVEKYYNKIYAGVVQLMANAPLRDGYDINNHLKHFF